MGWPTAPDSHMTSFSLRENLFDQRSRQFEAAVRNINTPCHVGIVGFPPSNGLGQTEAARKPVTEAREVQEDADLWFY